MMYGSQSSNTAARGNVTVTRETTEPSTIGKTRATSTKPPFYKFGTNWRKYVVRLDMYFANNPIEKDRKSAVLVTNICSKTYNELKQLCQPRNPNALQYEKLCALLGKHLAPPPKASSQKALAFRSRVAFYELKQVRGEQVFKWYERVKKAAACCDFGKLAYDKIKDRFVTGLSRGPVLERVCAERPKKPLIELVRIALEAEKAAAQSPKNPSPQYTQTNTAAAAAEPIAGRTEAKAKHQAGGLKNTPSSSSSSSKLLPSSSSKLLPSSSSSSKLLPSSSSSKLLPSSSKLLPSSMLLPSSSSSMSLPSPSSLPSKRNLENQTLGRNGVKVKNNAGGFKNTSVPSSSTNSTFADQTLNTNNDGILKQEAIMNLIHRMINPSGSNGNNAVKETVSTVSSTDSCRVCGRTNASRFDSESNCCNACIQFFRKSNKLESKPDLCINLGSCNWAACRSCRYLKCLSAGIKDASTPRKSKGNE